MTYILGARCSDGVVLVGDTKITTDEGAKFTFGKKLFKPFTSVVMGASGISGLYKSFQDRMTVAVQNLESQGLNVSQPEKLSIIAEEVIRTMHNIYGEDRGLIIQNLNVLMAIRTGEVAELRNFSPYGFPEPVNEYKAIGHGEPYGALFLDKMWSKPNTMEQTAKLGIFIIKLIEDTKIDNSVGFNNEFLPQVFYIPDVKFPKGFKISTPPTKEEIEIINETYAKHPIQELKTETVNHFINEISSKISEFENFFTDGQFKI
jgi:20S proteasome alpha/beta subunit